MNSKSDVGRRADRRGRESVKTATRDIPVLIESEPAMAESLFVVESLTVAMNPEPVLRSAGLSPVNGLPRDSRPLAISRIPLITE